MTVRQLRREGMRAAMTSFKYDAFDHGLRAERRAWDLVRKKAVLTLDQEVPGDLAEAYFNEVGLRSFCPCCG